MPTPGVKVEPNFYYSNILSTRSAQEQSRKNVACQLSGLEDVALNDFIEDDFSLSLRDMPNDVKTSWWSTYDMFEGLLHVKVALQSMPATSGCPVLTDLEWWVLEVGAEVLRPVMLAMMTLEGQNYVTGSLVIPMVDRIRKGLHAALDVSYDGTKRPKLCY